MTQEQKNLLLKDLCARLPYGVKYMDILNPNEQPSILQSIDECGLVMASDGFSLEIENVKPFLFPLSSMTEEQKKELRNLGWYFDNFEINNIDEFNTNNEYIEHSDCYILIDWLNKNHFDYRGLIKKELAIDATNLNIY